VLIGAVAVGCSSDEPKLSTPRSVDAGATAPPASVDAGAPVLAAPQEPAADAGAPVDVATASATANEGARELPSATPGQTKATAFDRILAKAKSEPGADTVKADTVKADIERVTGQSVVSVRRSARTWWLISFAPTSPPRDDAAQRQLVDTLKASGLFDKVEGDRMLKMTTP
jgi:hypothetical protein